MKTTTNLNKIVDHISDLIVAGLEINVDSNSKVKTISVRNPRNGKAVKFTFEVPIPGLCQIGDWVETPEQVKKPNA